VVQQQLANTRQVASLIREDKQVVLDFCNNSLKLNLGKQIFNIESQFSIVIDLIQKPK